MGAGPSVKAAPGTPGYTIDGDAADLGNVVSIDVGPIWSNAVANKTATDWLNAHGASRKMDPKEWVFTGEWKTHKPGVASLAYFRHVRQTLCVGPIYNNAEADAKVQAFLQTTGKASKVVFTGVWNSHNRTSYAQLYVPGDAAEEQKAAVDAEQKAAADAAAAAEAKAAGQKAAADATAAAEEQTAAADAAAAAQAKVAELKAAEEQRVAADAEQKAAAEDKAAEENTATATAAAATAVVKEEAGIAPAAHPEATTDAVTTQESEDVGDAAVAKAQAGVGVGIDVVDVDTNK